MKDISTLYVLMQLFFLSSETNPFQIFADKWIQIAIQDCGNVTGFIAGPVILHHGIWLEHIGTDLASPALGRHIATDLG